MPSWFNSPAFNAASAALVGVAALLVTVLPQHTIAFKVASAVVAFGAAHGIASGGLGKK